jgi:hypothetical protein
MFAGLIAQIAELLKIGAAILSVFVAFVSVAILFRGSQLVLWAVRGEFKDKMLEERFRNRYAREKRITEFREKKLREARLYRDYVESQNVGPMKDNHFRI